MDKVKKFVILPVSLLLLELFLLFNYASVYWFQYLPSYFWNAIPHILLSMLAVLLFVCGITVLYIWVFDAVSLKSLLNQSTAKAIGLAFAIDYLIILLVEPTLSSLLVPLYNSNTTPWLYVLFNALILTVKLFFVIFLTLWLALKPLHGRFSFRAKAFLVTALVCLLINVLFVFTNVQITNAILSNFQTGDTGNSAISYLSSLAKTNAYSKWLNIAKAIVFVIQDVIILFYINDCIKINK